MLNIPRRSDNGVVAVQEMGMVPVDATIPPVIHFVQERRRV